MGEVGRGGGVGRELDDLKRNIRKNKWEGEGNYSLGSYFFDANLEIIVAPPGTSVPLAAKALNSMANGINSGANAIVGVCGGQKAEGRRRGKGDEREEGGERGKGEESRRKSTEGEEKQNREGGTKKVKD